MRERFITTWRRTDNPLEWDHHVSDALRDVEEVVANLKKRGVHQYHTFRLGDQVASLSSNY